MFAFWQTYKYINRFPNKSKQKNDKKVFFLTHRLARIYQVGFWIFDSGYSMMDCADSFDDVLVFFDPIESQLVDVLANPARGLGCSQDGFRAGDGLYLNLRLERENGFYSSAQFYCRRPNG